MRVITRSFCLPTNGVRRRASKSVIMSKHNIPDGKLATVARKQYEIMRRVLEGTLDADQVAGKLQRIIEGAPTASFEVEGYNYTLGEKSYQVTTEVTKDFCEFAKARKIFGHNNFLQDLSPKQRFDKMPVSKTGRFKRTLRLAQVTQDTSFTVLQIQARQNGHILADAWDLIAFFEQSPFSELVHDKMDVNALGGEMLPMWFEGESGNKRTLQYIDVHGVAGNGWSLGRNGMGDFEKRNYPILKGQFILMRDK